MVTEREAPGFLARSDVSLLLDALEGDGRRVIGPTVADGAIVYDEIRAVADLPIGWHDDQSPGSYRLTHGSDDEMFGYASSPASWKRYTFPPRVPIGRSRIDDAGRVSFEPVRTEPEHLAFLGVRPCDMAALRVHDTVLLGSGVQDPDYAARRAGALVVAAECTRPASTCFCTSMGTGPSLDDEAGVDLVLTEVDGGFLVRSASPAGRSIAEGLPLRPATRAESGAATAALDEARATIAANAGVDTAGLHDRLMERFEDGDWQAVADRCLTCANCTMVCPTCFCTSVGQRSDLVGHQSTSERSWDSCFSDDFARVAGGNFRARPRDRYRQWLTHKFATWVDQFGTFGCVGCGRCIAWCPVGIDVREELARIAPRREAVMPIAAPLAPVATAPGQFESAVVAAAHADTVDTTSLVLAGVPDAVRGGLPGQFVMVTRPGLPPMPISISRYRPDGVVLTIRAAGPATANLIGLAPGAELGLRGPLGRPWPLEVATGRDVVIVAGGIGLAPVRPIIEAVLRERARFGALRLYYGARTPGDRLYPDDLAQWAASDDVEVSETVDRAGPDWLGRVGVVTQLFEDASWEGRRVTAFVCGPERMMQATANALAGLGVPADRTYVSLERHMECGVGLCGHCQMGRFFVCRDGPVFSLAELGGLLWEEGA